MAYGKEVGAKSIGVTKRPVKSDASYQGHLYRVTLKRETLDALHQQTIILASEVLSRSPPSGEQPS
jgi:hypothetical protein